MKARKVRGLDPAGTLAENAERIVAVRLDELRSFAARALDPEEVDALHDMRIAAKRLRYVLEITSPALGPAARAGAKTVRGLQDLLGEIHDCDVMLPRAQAHGRALRARDAEAVRVAAGPRARDLEPAAVRLAPNRSRYRGVEALSVYLIARRAVLFERFVKEWERLEARGFAAELLAGLKPPPEPAPSAPSDGAAP